MGTGTITMYETRLSLLVRVRDLGDAESWREFHAIYQPLIFGYLRSLGLKEHRRQRPDAGGLLPADGDPADVRAGSDGAAGSAPTCGSSPTRRWSTGCGGRRSATGRRKSGCGEFREADESESQRLEVLWTLQHRKRILEVTLPRVRATVSATAWACFEQRLLRGRPAAEIAAELGITANVVYVYASRVLKEVRRRCAEIEEELGDGRDLDLP